MKYLWNSISGNSYIVERLAEPEYEDEAFVFVIVSVVRKKNNPLSIGKKIGSYGKILMPLEEPLDILKEML